MLDHTTRLQALRQEMARHDIDAYIIPQTDEWQAESLFPCDERLHYICGLRASAGYVVVTQDKAVVLIDGRYTVQAKEQVDPDLFETVYYTEISPAKWAEQNIKKDGIMGLNPWLHTHGELNQNVKLIEENLIDAIWSNRPPSPALIAIAHDIQFSGKTTVEKIDLIAENCTGKTLISAPDSLAWLLNLRVLENTNAPGLRGYGVFNPANKTLAVYTDVDCTSFKESANVAFHPLNEIKNIGNALNIPKSAPSWFTGNVIEIDPCALPKACKNNIEQKGIRSSQKRDSSAMIETIQWIKTTSDITEKEIAKKLTENRSKQNLFRGESFPPIVGWNANGAKIHGTPSDTKIKGHGLLLIDSGGQYDDGTTDITRTIAIGTPSDDMREKYTLVLKAHIALATAVFPIGTTGIQLDAITRAPLWAAGLNFAHGTGHGVGHFLNVHEGPCNISPKATIPLQAGMFLSNEPGYYKEDDFGIRLENLMLVQPHENDGFLCFETVTHVPFEDDCIIDDMLSAKEKEWLENDHSSCDF